MSLPKLIDIRMKDRIQYFSIWSATLAVVMLLWVVPAEAQVQSYLEGRLTVDPEVDETEDYRGFEVLVMQDAEGVPDTLGFAVTDSQGSFSMSIEAPGRGMYPLIVSRRGEILLSHDLIVADGDSAEMNAQLPAPAMAVRIRSHENSAWAAYENTQALHNQSLIEMLQAEQDADDGLERNIMRTASMLWNLQESFPGTVGSEIAAAESIVMIEGWDDALAIERGQRVEPDAPGFVDVARALRRAIARAEGQEAAVEYLNNQLQRVQRDETAAALRAELVQARVDSLQRDEALAAVEDLQASHPDSPWAQWGDRTLYQLDNLMPGDEAPGATVTLRDGQNLSLSDLHGSLVLLEFFAPQTAAYRREIPLRQALHQAAAEGGHDFEIVTVSLEADDALNDAVFDEHEMGGHLAVAPEGFDSEIAEAYNITSLPTRYLIAPDGTIIDVFYEGAMLAVQEEVTRQLGLESITPEESMESPGE